MRASLQNLLVLFTLGSLSELESIGQQSAVNRPLEPIAAELEPSRIVTYKTAGGKKLGLHIFNPPKHETSDRRAAFVSFHGGGWTGGFPRRFYPFVDHFARLGLVGISVEYRLMNEERGITVFDCVKDARSAIRYIRAHASELGIDPSKLIVCPPSRSTGPGAHARASSVAPDAERPEPPARRS